MDHRALIDLAVETYERLFGQVDGKTAVTAAVEAVLSRTDWVVRDLQATVAGVRMENERLGLMLDQANRRASERQLVASA